MRALTDLESAVHQLRAANYLPDALRKRVQEFLKLKEPPTDAEVDAAEERARKKLAASGPVSCSMCGARVPSLLALESHQCPPRPPRGE